MRAVLSIPSDPGECVEGLSRATLCQLPDISRRCLCMCHVYYSSMKRVSSICNFISSSQMIYELLYWMYSSLNIHYY
jgi:hypothetical protein